MPWRISYPRDFDAPAGLAPASSLTCWLGCDGVTRAFYCIFKGGSVLNIKSEASSQLQTIGKVETLGDD